MTIIRNKSVSPNRFAALGFLHTARWNVVDASRHLEQGSGPKVHADRISEELHNLIEKLNS